MEKFVSGIRDKHPGSATLKKLTMTCCGETVRNHMNYVKDKSQIIKRKTVCTGKPWSRTW
jgi:hypothetical protein